jgi:hypothetical protein
MKFKEDYGDMIIAYDTGSWRKDVFPYYKANRRKAQEKSIIDWAKLFIYLNQIKEELKKVLPYKIMAVEKCEADDIIGCLVRYISPNESVMIISGDRDFVQLQNENVKQYDPVQKKNVTNRLFPTQFLLEHILRGDTGDGIPNVLSDDDTFVTDKRQKPLTKKKIKTMLQDFHPTQGLPNWKRNRTLIDLTYTPENLIIAIMDQYANTPTKDRRDLYSYLVQKDCRQLVESIGDF